MVQYQKKSNLLSFFDAFVCVGARVDQVNLLSGRNRGRQLVADLKEKIIDEEKLKKNMKKRQAMTSKNYNDEQNVKWHIEKELPGQKIGIKLSTRQNPSRVMPLHWNSCLTFFWTVWYHDNERFTINRSKIHYQFVDMSNSICNL